MDNQSAVKVSFNSIFHAQPSHTELDYHSIGEVQHSEIILELVSSHDYHIKLMFNTNYSSFRNSRTHLPTVNKFYSKF